MIKTLRVPITDDATPINVSDVGDYLPGKSLVLRNRSGTDLVMGGEDVTIVNGFDLLNGESLPVILERGEIVYLRGPAAGPYEVQVLLQGVPE